jgi:hypothetical protein
LGINPKEAQRSSSVFICKKCWVENDEDENDEDEDDDDEDDDE